MAAHIDLLPTIAEFCGVTNPRTLPLDGRSLAGLLTGARQEWPDRKLFVKGAIRTQRWLLVRSDKGDSLYDITTVRLRLSDFDVTLIVTA
jgi:arylsulfatase A-like enzyme